MSKILVIMVLALGLSGCSVTKVYKAFKTTSAENVDLELKVSELELENQKLIWEINNEHFKLLSCKFKMEDLEKEIKQLQFGARWLSALILCIDTLGIQDGKGNTTYSVKDVLLCADDSKELSENWKEEK